MDEISFDSIVKVTKVDYLTLQESTIIPSNLSASLLVDEKPASKYFGFDVDETCEFVQVHCAIKLQVRLDGWVEEGGLDLIHKDVGMVVDGVNVERWVIEIRGNRRDELRAGSLEELFIDR